MFSTTSPLAPFFIPHLWRRGFYGCIFAYSNWSSILKNGRGRHRQTNEFSLESDADGSRQHWTDGGSGGGTGDYRSRRAWQCVIVITVTFERKSRDRFYLLSRSATLLYMFSMPDDAGGDGEGWKVLISLLFCCLIITNQILLRYGKFNSL